MADGFESLMPMSINMYLFSHKYQRFRPVFYRFWRYECTNVFDENNLVSIWSRSLNMNLNVLYIIKMYMLSLLYKKAIPVVTLPRGYNYQETWLWNWHVFVSHISYNHTFYFILFILQNPHRHGRAHVAYAETSMSRRTTSLYVWRWNGSFMWV